MEKGEDEVAIKYMRKALGIYTKIGHNFGIGQVYYWLTEIYVGRQNWDAAIECAERGLEIPGHPWFRERIWLSLPPLWAYQQKNHPEKAIEYSKKALESVETINSMRISNFLATMEESFASTGKREEFISYCEKLMEKKGEALRDMKLNQWYLEPTMVSEIFTQTTFVDEFDGPDLMSEWEWVNPNGDSSYGFSKDGNWLEMRATSGSGLWNSNFHAPRLLQEVSGDFALEVEIKASSDDMPSVGGLLIWVERDNLIRFERGFLLENEVTFIGRIHSEYDCFGRGRLTSEILHLRLERKGDVFSAYCSDDGENWLTCGCMDFPAEDPIKVGICAIGFSWLPGGDTDTATLFDSFRVLRRPS